MVMKSKRQSRNPWRRLSGKQLWRAAAISAFHPPIGSDKSVNGSSGLRKPGLRSRFRADIIPVALHLFTLPVDRYPHAKSRSVIAPSEGSLFQAKEICSV